MCMHLCSRVMGASWTEWGGSNCGAYAVVGNGPGPSLIQPECLRSVPSRSRTNEQFIISSCPPARTQVITTGIILCRMAAIHG
ncbi:hypothetical protein NQZ68_015162 [Dissostichus eleginoides]|nr:hypothetical protein NQZ68_015162 [Dissostichus eleginoides]